MLPAQGTAWLELGVSFALGAACTSLVFYFRFCRPLVRISRASRLIASGDLSQTVPEEGPGNLKRVAGIINDMAADFQEVLVLFSDLVRSARKSARLLQLHVVQQNDVGKDSRHATEIREDFHQMQEMIRDFKYYRVRLEDEAIVDTGIKRRVETPASGGSGS